jgi:uncharacterized protein YhfF
MIEEMEDLQETHPRAGKFKLGDSKELCDRLNGMVRLGHKTVTCHALVNYNTEPEAMPKVDRCHIAAYWQVVPALVIGSICVDEIRFRDVGKEIALAEGENLDLEGWREDQKVFFGRNGGFDPEIILLFEHFELVEDLADC